jgi:hypothetical protein
MKGETVNPIGILIEDERQQRAATSLPNPIPTPRRALESNTLTPQLHQPAIPMPQNQNSQIPSLTLSI